MPRVRGRDPPSAYRNPVSKFSASFATARNSPSAALMLPASVPSGSTAMSEYRNRPDKWSPVSANSAE